MSTRSRANPWFRPIAPIGNALLDGVEADERFLIKVRPHFEPPVPDELYEEQCRARVRQMVICRLSTKWVLTARLLDPEFDAHCLEICPELGPLDPVTTAELRKAIERQSQERNS